MIGIVGHMSGGKSYYAVETMLKYLARGHIVCSNISLDCRGTTAHLQVPCVFWKRNYYRLVDEPDGIYHHILLRDYNNYPCGAPRGSKDYEQRMVYIFLDEASSCFDSMTNASDSGIRSVAVWARHSRKRGQEVYLIMQFANELNKRLRVHITQYISCNNSSNLRIPVLGLGLPWFMCNMSIRQAYLSDGETSIGPSQWVQFSPSVFQCYNTAQILVGSEFQSTSVYNLDRSLFFILQLKRLCIIVIVLLIIVSCLIIWGFLWLIQNNN